MTSPFDTLPETDPATILRYRDGQYAADVLGVAITHLDLFSWLNQRGPTSFDDIAREFDCAPRPLDVLLTFCHANGFTRKTETGAIEITRLAREHLTTISPWYLGPYYAPIAESAIAKDFLKTLRTGNPASWQAKDDMEDWHEAMHSEEFARGFTQLMNCRGILMGQKLAESLEPNFERYRRILDVGGGSGVYTAALIHRFPKLRGLVLEAEPVDQIARESLTSWGFQDRVEVVAGDMFQDKWPSECDAILLSNVLHDWDLPEISVLLQKAAAALPSGGSLVIHEAFLNEEKTGSLPVAAYSILLATITQGRCYAPSEYANLLKPLGFEVGPYRDTVADRGFMTAVKR